MVIPIGIFLEFLTSGSFCLRILTTRVTSEAAVELLFDAMAEVMEVVVGIVACCCCCCTDDAGFEVTTDVFDCNAVVLFAEVVAITALATLVVGAEDDDVEGGLSLVHISATHWAQGRAAYI